jgi:zinc protease
MAIRVLGGEGSNRLHRVLRSDRGLTYGAEASIHTLQFIGDIEARTATRTETTAEALGLMIEEFRRLRKERIGVRELSGVQAYMSGSFPLELETPDAIALRVLNVVFYGLDLGELATYRERVGAVTVDDIQRVSREYLTPERLSIVLVGDASAFIDDLAAAGFTDIERVLVTDLDLSSTDLTRSGSSLSR